MAYTVRNLIDSALRKIRVLGSGENAENSEAVDTQEVLTAMVDAWALEPLLIPIVSVIDFQLIDGVSEYTIGKKPFPEPLILNHIDVPRPEKILTAILRSETSDYQLRMIDGTTFAGISFKDSSSRPTAFYIRKGWPLNTIQFNSSPNATETLRLEVVNPMSEILLTASLDTVINLPPGYQQALIYNLAVMVSPEFGKSVPREIAAFAAQGKSLIKRANHRPITLSLDPGLLNRYGDRGCYDIYEGPG